MEGGAKEPIRGRSNGQVCSRHMKMILTLSTIAATSTACPCRWAKSLKNMQKEQHAWRMEARSRPRLPPCSHLRHRCRLPLQVRCKAEGRKTLRSKVVGVTTRVLDKESAHWSLHQGRREPLHPALLPMHTYGFGSRNQVICMVRIHDRQGSLIP